MDAWCWMHVHGRGDGSTTHKPLPGEYYGGANPKESTAFDLWAQ